jgi:hypothetical protein
VRQTALLRLAKSIVSDVSFPFEKERVVTEAQEVVDGLRLLKAFLLIKDPARRRNIIELAEKGNAEFETEKPVPLGVLTRIS